MKEYNECFEEMKRRLNCEFFKKTKKWIPGHRYDSIKETLYYLGCVKSRRQDDKGSEFIDDPAKCKEVYLAVRRLKSGETSISDVFKSRVIGDREDDIVVLDSPKSMVDSGSVLKDDFTRFEDYLDWLIPNSLNRCKKVQEFGYVSYDNPKIFFDVFAYFSEDPDYTKKLKTGIPPLNYAYRVVKDLVFDCLLNSWETKNYRSDMTLSKTKSVEQNMEALSNLFLSSGVKDGNALRNLYYSGLYKRIGIDLNEILTDVLGSWNEDNTIYGSFDNYMKFLFYTESRTMNQYRSQQRVKSATHKLETNTISELFGDGELKESLIDLINYARNNVGIGVSSYKIFDVGTKKEPKEFVTCIVTVDNILKFKSKKGESEITETLKHEIMLSKFCQLSISFDREGEIR